MALANPSVQDRRPSENHLSINLSSNNPFRNRTTTASPRTNSFNRATVSPQPLNRVSTTSNNNPFLDASEVSPRKPAVVNQDAVQLAADIFGDLSIENKPPQSRVTTRPHANPPPRPGPPPFRQPQPPRESRGRPTSDGRRPRGLSESSVQDRREHDRRDRRDGPEKAPGRGTDRPQRTESEERRRRERRKERDEKHKREGVKKESRSRKPQGLDLIDKLDVTGIYGQGLFHHDGPFDACNPHRNKKNHRAPMQAFPEGSANMALGGSGPVNAHLDLDRFHGRGAESFSEYAVVRRAEPNIINPTDRAPRVHGDETSGLGTSTFLEGAPASRSAQQRRDSQTQQDSAFGGLSRKKSLAQRLRSRGMSNSQPQQGGPKSPDARYGSMSDDSPPQMKAISAGGIPRTRFNKENEINPFDNDYQDAYDRKGAQIKASEMEKNAASVTFAQKSNFAGGPVLVRSVTADELPSNTRPQSQDETERSPGNANGNGGSFLNRMRSIKGSRK